MKKYALSLSAVILLTFAVSSMLAQGIVSPPVQNRRGVVDANKDGICDITGQKIGSGVGNGQGQQVRNGQRNGPGDGTGNQGNGPKDGTGYGAQSGKRLGPQDGTGIGKATRPGAGGPTTGGRVWKGGRR
jgi:hypothetical protein